MDRRKTIASGGAAAITATALVLGLGSGIGLWGLTGGGDKVGKLSPIDSTGQISRRLDDATSTTTTSSTIPAPLATTPSSVPHDVGDDHGVDRPGHDVGDDHGVDRPGTTVTAPHAEDDHHGDNRGPDSSNRGPGSDSSGPGSSGSGSGSSGSGHGEDD
ncbi:MAG TPA: hypothetical protein VGN59_01565 [Acidimicrobiia bacterium]|jgi:hypothetical protein